MSVEISVESEKNKLKLKNLKDRFLKPKIKEIRRNLYEIENKKNLSKLKVKEIEKEIRKESF